MLKSLEGKRVPEITCRTRRGNDWIDVSTEDLSRVAVWWCLRCRKLLGEAGYRFEEITRVAMA